MQVSWNRQQMSHLLLGQESVGEKSQGLLHDSALLENVFTKIPDNAITSVNQNLEVFVAVLEF